MKHILYLSYFYEPDLSAGSFRNTYLAKTLSKSLTEFTHIHLICTHPNRYASHGKKVPDMEDHGNLTIYRIRVPQHHNKFFKQLISFYYYQRGVWRIIRKIKFHTIFVSSSKLFTAHLAYRISKKTMAPYYLDLRDLFSENLAEFIPYPRIAQVVSKFVRKYFEIPTFLNAKHISINSEGFRDSIPKNYRGKVSFFPNGIDDLFYGWSQNPELTTQRMIVTYAGNIGEAQALHKIIPPLADYLKRSHTFQIIGAGSAKHKLEAEIERYSLTNILIIDPVEREQLLKYYCNSHYLFLHLNDYKSLEKVLPSKLFEYGGGNIPILAGIAGAAKKFMEDELKENIFIFEPCNFEMLKEYMELHPYTIKFRMDFIKKYNRQYITYMMTESILSEFYGHR